MRQLIASAWITLDGVFDADSMAQWFQPFDSESRQNYIRDGILACDAFLFGRTTYEMLAPYWSTLKNNEMGIAGQLNSAPKYVVSSTLKKADWNNSTIISENVREEITRLKQRPGREIQIEGSGTLIQALTEGRLVDEYRLLVHPIILGSGKRFFRDGMHTKSLTLVKTIPLDKGVIALHYRA